MLTFTYGPQDACKVMSAQRINLVKNFLRLSALLVLASTTVLAQNDRPASDTRPDNSSRNDDGREQIPLRQNGRPHSNVREDHSSKSVEPKARCTARAIPNQASEERGRRRDWMASIPLRGMKVQSDSQRKLSQIA